VHWLQNPVLRSLFSPQALRRQLSAPRQPRTPEWPSTPAAVMPKPRACCGKGISRSPSSARPRPNRRSSLRSDRSSTRTLSVEISAVVGSTDTPV